MPKIYILDRFHPAGVEMARKFCDIVNYDDPAVKNWPEDADGVMVRMTPVTGDEIRRAAKAGRLKIICKQGVGYDTIDIATAKEAGIPVSRTPGVNSEAVAELALGLSLAVNRRISELDRMLRKPAGSDRGNFLGGELGGKTIGVIGMGNIGTLAARKFHRAFDCKIVAYDPYVPADHWKDQPHTRVASLAEMLPQIDLLTVHCPLNKETRDIIDAKELAAMKKGAIVINCARGGIVNEEALYESIKSGHIFGAGLDVFDVEPPPFDHPLLTLDTVVATPHSGGGTRETQERSGTRVAQQVIDVLQGKPAANRIV
ncbi:MAG TPA: hydroxyacid dehydrogenase [Burkholderiales bacterium]